MLALLVLLSLALAFTAASLFLLLVIRTLEEHRDATDTTRLLEAQRARRTPGA